MVETSNMFLLGLEYIETYEFLDRVSCININDIDFDYKRFTKIDIKDKFPEIFNGLSNFKEIVDIPLKDDARPFIQSAPRIIPIPLYETIKQEINKLVYAGNLVPVEEPTEGVTQLFANPKKMVVLEYVAVLHRLINMYYALIILFRKLKIRYLH